jgi:Protein of unknown function (DUF4038)/Putative collagen-binding domain of a collagenase
MLCVVQVLAVAATMLATVRAEPARQDASATFPLKTDGAKRYLEDSAGKPFLLHGEAAWSLIVQPTNEEVEHYLSDRRARGFNTLLVNLIEHRFATKAPANIFGDPPFEVPGDFSTPNERYFAHVDWVLRRAAVHGFLVMLAPAFMGINGGPEGWYHEMASNGPDKLRRYGRFLGRRYRSYPNVLWVQGGDYNPPDRTLEIAVAEGIREEDPEALQTVHDAPETAALDYWKGQRWLNLNTIYTYRSAFRAARRQYDRSDWMPFVLIEGLYENAPGATAQRLRFQAYQVALTGAAGQVFGNNPIWHFGGPGLVDVALTWQQALNSPGTRGMTHLHRLLTELRWWELKPDTKLALLISGRGVGSERALAAQAADRTVAAVYMPSARHLIVDLAQLAGPVVVTHWFDPANGELSPANSAPLLAGQPADFNPPAPRNSDGGGDWVLVLQSQRANTLDH